MKREEELEKQNEWLKDRLADLQLPSKSHKNIEEWLTECGMPALLATPKTEAEPVLDKPTRIGGTVFRKGVKVSTVIAAAQRFYEYSASKQEAEPVAWMSIERLNAIISAAQYRNALPKNRKEYCIPLYAHPPKPEATEGGAYGSVEGSPLLEWAVSKWNEEVKHRPLVNVHRRSLDDTWRQVIRWAGGDPVKLVGPSHDQLLEQAEKNQ